MFLTKKKEKKSKIEIEFFLISFHCIKQLKKSALVHFPIGNKKIKCLCLHFVNKQDTQKCAILLSKYSYQLLAFRFLVEIETFPQRCLQFTSLNCFLTLLFLSSSFFFFSLSLSTRHYNFLLFLHIMMWKEKF